MKICRVRLGTHGGQDLFKGKYKDNVQVCLVPDIKRYVDNSVIVGRTLLVTNGGMALLNPNETRMRLPRGSNVAKAHLVKTRHIRVFKDEITKQNNQDEQQRLELLSLSTKDETLDQNRLKFNIGDLFSLNSSSFPDIPSTKFSISSSVL